MGSERDGTPNALAIRLKRKTLAAQMENSPQHCCIVCAVEEIGKYLERETSAQMQKKRPNDICTQAGKKSWERNKKINSQQIYISIRLGFYI